VSSRGELVAKLFAEHYAPTHLDRSGFERVEDQARTARRYLEGMGTSLAARHRGLIALSARESHRVLKLWTQTVAAPILSSFLFIVVFGLSLGSRIKQIDGVEYEVFIVPGLIAMAMIQATYANNSASVFQARFDRYLNDVLAAPMRPWEVNLALSIGGVVRALLIGAGLLACAMAVVDVPVRHPLELVVAVALALVLFSSFGVIVGVYANSWDHTAFVTNIVILPLTFLGGVFYSVDRLPAPWHEISHANPIFYLLNTVRYGFLGTSDVSVLLSLGVTGALAAAMVAWSSWLFRTGHRLKP
jgi:ABC-2 type transport system permease protein